MHGRRRHVLRSGTYANVSCSFGDEAKDKEEKKDDEKDEEEEKKDDEPTEQMLDGMPESFVGPLIAHW